MAALPPVIFDRSARRLRRDRAARAGQTPLEAGLADELSERLDLVSRTFETALVINTGAGVMAKRLRLRGLIVSETDHGTIYAEAAAGFRTDEDRLFPPDRYDLVVMPAGLDTVDDVPGALIAARRALRPGGMFLGSLIGSPGLPVLRDLAATADAREGRAVARFHPLIDVRAAGDLMARSGFALPVADAETLSLSYSSLDKLLGDLRQCGLTNVLAERHPVSRQWLNDMHAGFAGRAGTDGRVTETVSIIMLTGWAPEAAAHP